MRGAKPLFELKLRHVRESFSSCVHYLPRLSDAAVIGDEVGLFGLGTRSGPVQGRPRRPARQVRGKTLMTGMHYLMQLNSPRPELNLNWSAGPLGPRRVDCNALRELAEGRRRYE